MIACYNDATTDDSDGDSDEVRDVDGALMVATADEKITKTRRTKLQRLSDTEPAFTIAASSRR